DRNVGYDVDVEVNESPSSLIKLRPTFATRSASRIPGGGESISRVTRPNIAAFAPMASANVTTTPATNVGSRRSVRIAYLTSRPSFSNNVVDCAASSVMRIASLRATSGLFGQDQRSL